VEQARVEVVELGLVPEWGLAMVQVLDSALERAQGLILVEVAG
jgi:hypothetical protein